MYLHLLYDNIKAGGGLVLKHEHKAGVNIISLNVQLIRVRID